MVNELERKYVPPSALIRWRLPISIPCRLGFLSYLGYDKHTEKISLGFAFCIESLALGKKVGPEDSYLNVCREQDKTLHNRMNGTRPAVEVGESSRLSYPCTLVLYC